MGLVPQPPNGISDDLKKAFDNSDPFTIRLTTSLMYHPSREAALAAINADASLIHDEKLWHRVDALTAAMRADLTLAAISMMQQHLPQAVAVLVAGLNSPNERSRLSTAKYLTERFLGKPTAHTKVDVTSNKETVTYVIQGISPDMWAGDDDNDTPEIIDGDYE